MMRGKSFEQMLLERRPQFEVYVEKYNQKVFDFHDMVQNVGMVIDEILDQYRDLERKVCRVTSPSVVPCTGEQNCHKIYLQVHNVHPDALGLEGSFEKWGFSIEQGNDGYYMVVRGPFPQVFCYFIYLPEHDVLGDVEEALADATQRAGHNLTVEILLEELKEFFSPDSEDVLYSDFLLAVSHFITQVDIQYGLVRKYTKTGSAYCDNLLRTLKYILSKYFGEEYIETISEREADRLSERIQTAVEQNGEAYIDPLKYSDLSVDVGSEFEKMMKDEVGFDLDTLSDKCPEVFNIIMGFIENIGNSIADITTEKTIQKLRRQRGYTLLPVYSEKKFVSYKVVL